MITDNSGNLITNSYGELIESYADQLAYSDSDFETSLRYFSENRRREMVALWGMVEYMKRHNIFTNLQNLWPILPFKPDSLTEWTGGTKLISSGDHTFTDNGISGDGTYYFDTGWNPSLRVTDINNFSIGIYIQDDSNGGSDFACDDGTNFCSVTIRDGDNTTIKIGTATDTFPTPGTSSIGHWVVNVRDGNFRTYLNGVEVGTSTAVAGSLPNYNAYLGGNNATGTPGSFSSKTYSTVWNYGGKLEELEVQQMDKLAHSLNMTYNRDIL